MAVETTGPAVLKRWETLMAPGQVSGTWKAVVLSEGDGGAGNNQATIQLPNSILFLWEGFSVRTANVDTWRIDLQNEPGFVLAQVMDAGTTFAGPGSVNMSGDSNLRRYIETGKKAVTQLTALTANVDTEDITFIAWGLWWDVSLARLHNVQPDVR